MVTLGPDEWQTYDITLVGRLVTVVADGKTIISNQGIPGITRGALGSNEGEPYLNAYRVIMHRSNSGNSDYSCEIIKRYGKCQMVTSDTTAS
ncbi:hypothetical protein ACUN24_10280 [Pedobacter sp. WC2501]|uniref:hypothetical protein n=1 Tax=Pedobacter sp. WC2501 TaxID=3461400 RepID=UPI0040459FAA